MKAEKLPYDKDKIIEFFFFWDWNFENFFIFKLLKTLHFLLFNKFS